MFRHYIYVCAALAALVLVGCGEPDDLINRAHDTIIKELEGTNIYERGNLSDPPPATIAGYYDIIDGSFRYITNEYENFIERPGRRNQREIKAGDLVSLYFDARVYKGSFSGATTFYTNMASRISGITGNNPFFDTEFFPDTPLEIVVGDDPGILKSVQTALIGCRVAEELSEDDPDADKGDEVRVYLPPDVGFGNRSVFNVPANSTLVFELTDLRIIE